MPLLVGVAGGGAAPGVEGGANVGGCTDVDAVVTGARVADNGVAAAYCVVVVVVAVFVDDSGVMGAAPALDSDVSLTMSDRLILIDIVPPLPPPMRGAATGVDGIATTAALDVDADAAPLICGVTLVVVDAVATLGVVVVVVVVVVVAGVGGAPGFF